jgi:hypothetical protein
MVRRDWSALVTATIEEDAESCAEGDTGSSETEAHRADLRPFHVEWHLSLLELPDTMDSAPGKPERNIRRDGGYRVPAGTAPVVDAIVVPTTRSAGQLRSAVDLAAKARCELVALYTGSFPDGLSDILGKLQPRAVTALAIDPGITHPLLDLGTTLPQSLVSECALDISRKRNLGLLISRARGWRSILLLDDDIRRLNPDKLNSAAQLLDRYPVVGLQVNKYPDASVVGHARRLTGRKQHPFLSGGSLLVDPERLRGFFPPVYHEDWLCVLDHLRLGEVAVGGKVGQLPYKPFTTRERAQLEEFGDILASGLLWLVHAEKKENDASPCASDHTSRTAQRIFWSAATNPRFWQEILKQRTELLDGIVKRLELVHKDDTSPVQSVEAARQRCAELSAGEFVSFVQTWLEAEEIWRASVRDVPPADSVSKAVARLGLSHAIDVFEPGSPPVKAPDTPAAQGRPRLSVRAGVWKWLSRDRACPRA